MYSTKDMKFSELCSRCLRDFFRLRNNFKPSSDQQQVIISLFNFCNRWLQVIIQFRGLSELSNDREEIEWMSCKTVRFTLAQSWLSRRCELRRIWRNLNLLHLAHYIFQRETFSNVRELEKIDDAWNTESHKEWWLWTLRGNGC